VAVGVAVTVTVGVAVVIGVAVGVAVGQGLAMMVIKRVKEGCTPSSITTWLVMGLSWGMGGAGPLQPKVMVCVSLLASEPAQVMVSVSGS
jgi:hypothetical protein